MEKYIFDCRQKLYETPKYLKRNHKMSCQTLQQNNNKCDYLKNKIFVTFDYSYYQRAPMAASLHVGTRINCLNALVEQGNQQQVLKSKPDHSHLIDNNPRWKKQKHNCQSFSYLEPKKHIASKYGKKVKGPLDCSPAVGSYQYEDKNLHKKIVYDVTLRGKKQNNLKFVKLNSFIQSQTNKKRVSNKQNSQVRIALPRNSKSCGSGPYKERKNLLKMRKIDQQYQKFIASIQTTNVWKKLMQKHRLKGSKFDLYGYEQ